MKKIIITSAIIATILALALIALYDLEVVLTILLTCILIGLVASIIAMTWNGIAEIKAEIERRREAKRMKRRQRISKEV